MVSSVFDRLLQVDRSKIFAKSVRTEQSSIISVENADADVGDACLRSGKASS